MTARTTDAMSALDAAQAAVQNATAAASSAALQTNYTPMALWTPDLVRFLAVSILIFTFAALLLGSLLLWRSGAEGTQVLRVFGVLSIIGVSALLLVVGYSNDQLTPIVGLFGALAGYLLGKDASPQTVKSSPGSGST
jgi:hypothetical protein